MISLGMPVILLIYLSSVITPPSITSREMVKLGRVITSQLGPISGRHLGHTVRRVDMAWAELRRP